MSMLLLQLLLISPFLVNGSETDKLHARVAAVKDRLYTLKDNIASMLKDKGFLEPENILGYEKAGVYFAGEVNAFKVYHDLSDLRSNLLTLQAFADVVEGIDLTESSVNRLSPAFDDIDSCKVEIKLAEKLQTTVKESLQRLDKYLRFMKSGLKYTVDEVHDKSTVADGKIPDIEKALTSAARRIGVRIK